MKLSILIPTFNKSNFTEACLKDLSLLNKNEVEIIIIDNASTDKTSQLLSQAQEIMTNLVVITNEKNLGFGKALNKAYEQAKGERIIFLNNDIRVLSDCYGWIEPLLEACQGAVLVGPTGGKLDARNGFEFLFETADTARFPEINYISGWCIAAKKEEFDKLILETNEFKGPWREEFFAYFEDADLSFRALQQGFKLKMVRVPVKHFGRITSSQLNINKLYNQSKKIFFSIWSSRLTR